jgi:hypothetical protein
VADLSEKQAYEAMREFLKAFWERGGRTSGDIEEIIRWTDTKSGLGVKDDEPFDPAMWPDWLEAVRRARADWP